MRITRMLAVLSIGILLILGSCTKVAPSKSPATPTSTPEPQIIVGYAEVLIPGRSFNPDALTIGVGTTVTWVNKDGEHHTITSDDGLFNGTVGPFASFSYTFNERGDFEYYCGVYGQMGMRGVVHVK